MTASGEPALMRRAREFLRTPPRPLSPQRRLPLWAVAAVVPALTALQMFRRPTSPPVWDSLWAEDGKIFLSQAVSANFVDTLGTSYNGYLHTVPRFITIVATWFPIERAPLVMSLITALILALLSVYVFEASAAWIASPLLRGVLGLAVPFLPVTGREMAGTVALLHFYLDYAAFWAVVSVPRSRAWLALSTLVAGLAILSDPLCGVLLPIAVLFAVRTRTRSAWLVPATLALGLVAQLVLRDQATAQVTRVKADLIPRIFAERATSSLLAGDRYLKDVFGGHTGSPFAWASLVLVASAIAVGLWRLRGRRWWLLAGSAALSVTFFLVPILTRGTQEFVPKAPWALGSSRYLYIPVMFLLIGLLAAVDRSALDGRRLRLPEVAAAVAALAVFGANYREPHRSSGQHRWGPRVAEARVACTTNRRVGGVTVYASRVNGLTAAIPGEPKLNWRVAVPCSKLH